MKLLTYESPIVQFLSKIGDIIILNLLFLLCSIPVVTIGASQAGLFTALKVLHDKEDDRSYVKAFFRGFSAGFWKITVLWCVFLILTVLLMGNVIGTMFYQHADPDAPVGMSIVALCIIGLFEALIVLFHSHFNCTILQLIKNSWLLLLAYPFHAVFIFVLTWLPFAVFLIDMYVFMLLTPILLLCYFSLTYGFSLQIISKPFQRLIDTRNE